MVPKILKTKFESVAVSAEVKRIFRALVVVMLFPRLYAAWRSVLPPVPPPSETHAGVLVAASQTNSCPVFEL